MKCTRYLNSSLYQSLSCYFPVTIEEHKPPVRKEVPTPKPPPLRVGDADRPGTLQGMVVTGLYMTPPSPPLPIFFCVHHGSTAQLAYKRPILAFCGINRWPNKSQLFRQNWNICSTEIPHVCLEIEKHDFLSHKVYRNIYIYMKD